MKISCLESFMHCIFVVVILVTNAYNFAPLTKYVRKDGDSIHGLNVIERSKAKKEQTTCLLFFTGGSSMIPPQIYGHLMDCLASVGFSIYAPHFHYENKENIVDILLKDYKDVILVGHSSGGTTAINYAKNPNVRKLILLDPVDTRLFSKKYRNKTHDLENLEMLMFLNAEKSYKLTFTPPALPFIPFLSVKPDILRLKDTCKIIQKEATNFGHSDILDLHYSNIMHGARVSVGHQNRSYSKMEEYHKWLVNHFYFFSKMNMRAIKKIRDIY